MRPEASVILLTTLTGAGQGLFLALFVAQVLALSGLVAPRPDAGFDVAGSAIALVLCGAGLVASFFHLGRPERAWRAIAQWRTSWLSREVIVLPAFMGAVFAWGVAQWLGWPPTASAAPGSGAIGPAAAIGPATVIGLLGALLALALFVCTAMIYACLPFLREWHSPLTLLNFTLLGCASGFTLAAALASRAAPDLTGLLTAVALAFTLLGLASRGASLARNARLKPKSTLQTAIGIRHPRIVQTSMGFQAGSFNTHEFFHGRPPGTLRWVKWAFLAAAFVLPAALLAAAMAAPSTPLLALAFAVQMAGLVAERWFFFAEANHPQNLYYSAVA